MTTQSLSKGPFVPSISNRTAFNPNHSVSPIPARPKPHSSNPVPLQSCTSSPESPLPYSCHSRIFSDLWKHE
ncbi:serine/threonine protein kinase [Sesbania bispinosa]|nr:serine/threonine protein kinase [Sesbania bispinosa]